MKTYSKYYLVQLYSKNKKPPKGGFYIAGIAICSFCDSLANPLFFCIALTISANRELLLFVSSNTIPFARVFSSPIIMMADRQTTGGYTKIATVITPDLSKLAQMSPGNWMNFEMITIEKSHIIYKEYEHRMETIKDFVKENNFEFNEVRNLKLSINGTSFNVGVREVE